MYNETQTGSNTITMFERHTRQSNPRIDDSADDFIVIKYGLLKNSSAYKYL